MHSSVSENFNRMASKFDYTSKFQTPDKENVILSQIYYFGFQILNTYLFYQGRYCSNIIAATKYVVSIPLKFYTQLMVENEIDFSVQFAKRLTTRHTLICDPCSPLKSASSDHSTAVFILIKCPSALWGPRIPFVKVPGDPSSPQRTGG